MKIQTYDSNGIITSSNKVEGSVPEYIMEFDDSMSIFNFSDSEYKLIKSNSSKPKRKYLIEKYKWLIKYDYELYLSTILRNLFAYFPKGPNLFAYFLNSNTSS